MTNIRVPVREYAPGTPAPKPGIYQQHNFLGSVTGVTVSIVNRGQKLPPAPRGFTWSVVASVPDQEAAD